MSSKTKQLGLIMIILSQFMLKNVSLQSTFKIVCFMSGGCATPQPSTFKDVVDDMIANVAAKRVKLNDVHILTKPKDLSTFDDVPKTLESTNVSLLVIDNICALKKYKYEAFKTFTVLVTFHRKICPPDREELDLDVHLLFVLSAHLPFDVKDLYDFASFRNLKMHWVLGMSAIVQQFPPRSGRGRYSVTQFRSSRYYPNVRLEACIRLGKKKTLCEEITFTRDEASEIGYAHLSPYAVECLNAYSIYKPSFEAFLNIFSPSVWCATCITVIALLFIIFVRTRVVFSLSVPALCLHLIGESSFVDLLENRRQLSILVCKISLLIFLDIFIIHILMNDAISVLTEPIIIADGNYTDSLVHMDRVLKTERKDEQLVGPAYLLLMNVVVCTDRPDVLRDIVPFDLYVRERRLAYIYTDKPVLKYYSTLQNSFESGIFDVAIWSDWVQKLSRSERLGAGAAREFDHYFLRKFKAEDFSKYPYVLKYQEKIDGVTELLLTVFDMYLRILLLSLLILIMEVTVYLCQYARKQMMRMAVHGM